MDEFEVITAAEFKQHFEAPDIDEVTKAWIAGFFDGEGCVQAELRGNALRCKLSITNTNREALEIVESFYGGGIVDHSRKKTAHVWFLTGVQVEAFALDIVPYSVIKKSQLELVLHARTLLRNPKVQMSDELVAERQRVHSEMRRLKRM